MASDIEQSESLYAVTRATICALLKKAENPLGPQDALHYTQAALNAANAFSCADSNGLK